VSKFIKLRTNSSKIFTLVTIFGYVGDGLAVAETALDTTIQEIYKTNASFKFLGTLESVLTFVKTAKEAVDTFTSIFGLLPKRGTEAKNADDLKNELNTINGKIKELL
jgi:hypothetical protein